MRGRGHGDQQRAAGAAGAQGAGAAGRRAGRHVDHLPRSPGDSATTWDHPSAEAVWNEVRSLAPIFAGMSYARLEAEGGLQWPCYDEQHPGELFLHSRLWKEPREGPPAPFSVVEHDPPVERPDDEYPFQLTTGRRLDSYNTGVQTGGYSSPLRRGESLDISPEDAERLGAARRRSGAGHLAARQRRGAGAHRPLAARGPGVHDPPFPGRGRDERADASTRPTRGPARPNSRRARCGWIRFAPAPSASPHHGSLPQTLSLARPRLGSPLSGRGTDGRGARGGRRVPRPARRRAGTAASASPGTPIPPKAATRPGAGDTSSCRPSTPSSPGSGGSARARSTTSPSGSPCRRRTRTAWRRSTPSSPRCRAPGGWCTCATTSPAGARARSSSAPSSSERLDPPTTAPTATITRFPTRGVWLRSPCLGLCDQAPAALLTVAGEAPVERLVGDVTAASVARLLAGDLSSAALPHPRLPSGGRRVAPAPQAGGRGRPREPGRLPRQRRVPTAPAGAGSGTRKGSSGRCRTPS